MKCIAAKCLSSVFLIGAFSVSAPGGETTPGLSSQYTRLSLDDTFRSGQWEASFAAGPLFSPMVLPKNRPVVNYALGSLQLGYMLTSPEGGGLFRGNLEFVPEGFGAGVFGGDGSYVAGGTFWMRYNFVTPGSRLVPYAQAGVGFTFMDIDHRYDGQNFNFNVDAAAGLRWFFSERWAMNLEYRFQHISNANMGQHNIGINADGPMLGVSWFF